MLNLPSNQFSVRIVREYPCWVVRSYCPSLGFEESRHATDSEAIRIGMSVWSMLDRLGRERGWTDRSSDYWIGLD